MHRYSLVAIHKHAYHICKRVKSSLLKYWSQEQTYNLILAVSKLMKVNYNTITLYFIYLPSKTEEMQTFIPFVR